MTVEMRVRLAPPRHLRVGGLGLGVLAINPDPADPAALLGVFDPAAGTPRTHRVHPGDTIAAGGGTVLIGEVVPGREGYVEVTVQLPEPPS
jgi:hypothetical protein